VFIIILLGKFLRPSFYAEPHFICNRIFSFWKAKLLTIIIDIDIDIVIVIVIVVVVVVVVIVIIIIIIIIIISIRGVFN